MKLQTPMLTGEWDVSSNGAHSILTLLPAGTFTHCRKLNLGCH
jgi:hypothetical protein